MKCQIMFFGKYKKTITNLLFAELVLRAVKIKYDKDIHVILTLYCKRFLSRYMQTMQAQIRLLNHTVYQGFLCLFTETLDTQNN